MVGLVMFKNEERKKEVNKKPSYVCHECGVKYGERVNRQDTQFMGFCSYCQTSDVPLTNIRHYNNLPRYKNEV